MFFYPCMMVNILRRGKNHLTKSPEICIRCIGVSRIQFGCSEKKKRRLFAPRSPLLSVLSSPCSFGRATPAAEITMAFSSLLFPSLFPPLPSIRRPATQQQQCYRFGGSGSSSSSCPDWVDITRGRRRRRLLTWRGGGGGKFVGGARSLSSKKKVKETGVH